MPHISLNQLAKAYRSPVGAPIQAVRELSFAVEPGELLALVGPSGCGKTTTLRLLAGLEQPDSGSLQIDGKDALSLPPEQRGVAMVFQNLALFPHFTVRENLASGLRWRKTGRAETGQRVEEIAARMGLAACLDRLPETLSGGQRQRVALGRALILRPAALLLDEPLSNLDAPLRAEMRRELVTLNRESGMTMIYVTHDQAEAMAVGKRIAVLAGGRLQQIGTPAEIYQHPATRFVAEFFGSPRINWMRGTLAEEKDGWKFSASLPGNASPPSIPVPAAEVVRLGHGAGPRSVMLGIRPQHLCVTTGSAAQGGLGVAKVKGVEMLGAETHVHLDWHGVSLTVCLNGSEASLGDEVQLALRVGEGLIFEDTTARFVA